MSQLPLKFTFDGFGHPGSPGQFMGSSPPELPHPPITSISKNKKHREKRFRVILLRKIDVISFSSFKPTCKIR
jgi:hypothetical protein